MFFGISIRRGILFSLLSFVPAENAAADAPVKLVPAGVTVALKACAATGEAAVRVRTPSAAVRPAAHTRKALVSAALGALGAAPVLGSAARRGATQP
mmetsp:Transcript_25953/g.60164  ORF Transcript_25953/g.60164 Transcript_25953/m.60164 type:complete len:97 (+) Transcript_25953:562-852(+)